MKKFLKQCFAIVTALSASACCTGLMTVSAATPVSTTVSPGVVLTGSLANSWYNPSSGVYIYTVTASSVLSGASPSSGNWYLLTGLHLDEYSTGALIQSNYVTGGSKVTPVNASVTGNRRNIQAKAFGSHEVRGAYSGGVYTSYGPFYI